MRVSVIGLGKLGSPLAAVLADKGFEVVGVDTNAALVADLTAGRAPVCEPGLQELIDRAGAHLRATTDVAEAIACTDATFVIVPTPSGSDGAFSNAHVISAVRAIGADLRTKTSYHLVVITSTVMPGSTGGPIREALEAAAGRAAGETIGLCYSPEFIALGTVIHDMLNPDFVLIGEHDARAGDMLEAIYRKICENKPPVRRMNFVNAEMAKIAVNTYVTTKISFANMVAGICDHLPGGADAVVVLNALGCDSRIGGKYLRPGLGYGGPCFPRDNVALSTVAHRLKVPADIAEATDRINRRQPERVTALVRRLLPHGTVGILGLSYKPGSPVTEQSQAVDIAASLAAGGYQIIVYDPAAVMPPPAAGKGVDVTMSASAGECAAAADVLIVLTPWRAFRDLAPGALRRPNGRRVPVIDCWQLLQPEKFEGVADLIYPGRGPATESSGDTNVHVFRSGRPDASRGADDRDSTMNEPAEMPHAQSR